MYLLLVIGPALPSSPFSEVHSLVGSFSKGSRKQWFRIRTVSRHFLTLAVVLTGYDILGSHFLSLGVPLLVKSVAVNTPLVIWHFFPCKWHGFFFFYLSVQRIFFSFSLKFNNFTQLCARVIHSRAIFLVGGKQYVTPGLFILNFRTAPLNYSSNIPGPFTQFSSPRSPVSAACQIFLPVCHVSHSLLNPSCIFLNSFWFKEFPFYLLFISGHTHCVHCFGVPTSFVFIPGVIPYFQSFA